MERFAEPIGLQIPSRTVFDNRQKSLIFDEISKLHTVHMETVLEQLKREQNLYRDKTLDLMGDCAFDSAGFSAQWGIYTFITVEQPHKIVASVLCRKSDANVGNVSSRMEIEGFRIGMNQLVHAGFRIGRVVTDQNASIGKLIREEFPTVLHEWDTWHWIKSKVRCASYG